MDKVVIYGGIIEGVSLRKDKSLKIMIGANEVLPDIMGDIMSLGGSFVYTAHKIEPFVNAELDAIKQLKYAGKPIDKSPAEKMRDLLFRLWQKQGCGFQSFDDYYLFTMQKHLDDLRDQLSKLNV